MATQWKKNFLLKACQSELRRYLVRTPIPIGGLGFLKNRSVGVGVSVFQWESWGCETALWFWHHFRHIHIRVCNANIVLITQGLCSSVSVAWVNVGCLVIKCCQELSLGAGRCHMEAQYEWLNVDWCIKSYKKRQIKCLFCMRKIWVFINLFHHYTFIL